MNVEVNMWKKFKFKLNKNLNQTSRFIFSDKLIFISLIILAISSIPLDLIFYNILLLADIKDDQKIYPVNVIDQDIKVDVDNTEIRVSDPDVNDYAFNLLTPTGKELFDGTLKLQQDQKTPEFASFAQKLKCASNVSEVLYSAGYPVPSHLYDSVPGIKQYIESIGGKIYHLPKYDGTNKQQIIDFLNNNFPNGNIPTGALIAGCASESCHSNDQSKSHISILGDSNEQGHMLLYHNNWLRPSILKGKRHRYMPEVKNFYHKSRPRQWMPTPWIDVARNDQGKISDFHMILPELDDLDPLNLEFYIKIMLVPEIITELKQKEILNTHKKLTVSNVHNINIDDINNQDFEYCISKKPLKLLRARNSADGLILNDLNNYLAGLDTFSSFFTSTFEFIVLKSEFARRQKWYSIYLYDQGRFWGGDNQKDQIWIKSKNTECKTKRQWFLESYS